MTLLKVTRSDQITLATRPFVCFLIFIASNVLVPTLQGADVPAVRTIRVPDHGLQPQVAVDSKGMVHLIYLTGDPSHSDIYYVFSPDGGETFSKPVRVNSQPGSAIAIGTVRGPHLALGREGKVHVAWMGSSTAEPKALSKFAPMLYTRLSDNGQTFEPQRNVIQSSPGLDGGGSIAADSQGKVYIAWHAPKPKAEGEQSRQVWLTASTDDGKTFAPEYSISPATGACGCCGMKLAVGVDGSIHALYRSADQMVHRDMTLLRLDSPESKPQSQIVGKMQSGTCVMSTSAFAVTPTGDLIGAWQTGSEIDWSPLSPNESALKALAVSGRSSNCKHPALAINQTGQILIAWTEGTGWNKGGSVAWQVYENTDLPAKNGDGHATGLPAWDSPAAFARPDGSFVIVY